MLLRTERVLCASLATLLAGCIGYRTPLDDVGGNSSDVGDAPRIADAAADGVDWSPPSLGCTPGVVPLVRAMPAVMFVLDRSVSMEYGLAINNVVWTRWQVLQSALATVLPPVDSSMAIGALIFPLSEAGIAFCSIPSNADLLPATGNVASLLRLMDALPPDGGTPTAAAIEVAANALLRLRAGQTSRVMVLATDGAPNCNPALNFDTCRCSDGSPEGLGIGCYETPQACLDDVRTMRTISGYASKGLPTYVIAIQSLTYPGFTDVLDAMAVAGGRARAGSGHRYYAATSDSDLRSALTAIRDQVGACTYLTSSVPGPAGSIVLAAEGSPLLPDQWMWGDKTIGEILLLGDACEAMTKENPPRITATVECG